jgi:hypothetical protein
VSEPTNTPPPPSGLPADRYGRGRGSRPGRRAATVLAVGVLALAGLAWLLWAALFHANPPIRSTLVGYQVASDTSVSVMFQVVKDPEYSATCVIRARDQEGTEVGRREVGIPLGVREATLTEQLRTTRRAITGEVRDCRLDR